MLEITPVIYGTKIFFKEVATSSSFSILNYNNMARRFNQRNKKGNFFKVLYEQREG